MKISAAKRESDRRYREVNREKICARKQMHYQNNREKDCARRRAYHKAHREKQLIRFRAYKEANREKILARQALYREVNREKVQACQRLHYWVNRERYLASVAKRRARKLGATPEWISVEQLHRINNLYEAAKMLSERSAFRSYVVDHIVPLRGRRVCGLHVPWNLQILTAEENGGKHNYMPPTDQLVDYSAPGYVGVRSKLRGRVA